MMKNPMHMAVVAATAIGFSAVPCFSEDVLQQTGLTPHAIATGDFDRDGRTDLAVAHVFDGNLVLLQRGTDDVYTNAQQLTVGANPNPTLNAPRHMVAMDVNNDGWQDLVVLCSGNFSLGSVPSIQVIWNRGVAPHFVAGTNVRLPNGESVDLFPVHFSLGGFSISGKTDLAVAQLRDKSIRILAASPANGFAPVGQVIPLEVGTSGPEFVLTVDVDGDGLDDLVAATAEGIAWVRQSAPGVFDTAIHEDFGISTLSGRALAWNDYDADGFGDLAIADPTGRVHVILRPTFDGNNLGVYTVAEPALNQPSAIIPFSQPGVLIPNNLVANAAGGTISSLSLESVLGTGTLDPRPRFLHKVDANDDGLKDVIVLHHGDLDSAANRDITVIHSAAPTSYGLPEAEVETGSAITDSLGVRLRRPQGGAVANNSSYWILENDRLAIQSINPNSNLNSNPGSRTGQRIVLPFLAGGLFFSSPAQYFIVERFSPAIHRRTTSQGTQETIAFAQAPGTLGYTGLAYNPDAEIFYLADPGNSQIVRLSRAGVVLGTFPVTPPAFQVSWHPTQARLYATNPSSLTIQRYDAAGTQEPSELSVGQGIAYLEQGGLAAVGFAANNTRMLLLSTNGLIIETTLAGSIEAVTSAAPAMNVQALDYDSVSGKVLVLGEDAHVARLHSDTLAGGELVSLWPLIAANPDFIPAGVAGVPNQSTFHVLDGKLGRLALLSETGVVQSVTPLLTAFPQSLRPNGGLSAQPTTGALAARTSFGIFQLDTGVYTPAPQSPSADFAWVQNRFYVSGDHAGVLHSIPIQGSETVPQSILIPGNQSYGGFLVKNDSELIFLNSNSSSVVQRYTLPATDDLPVTDWIQY